MCCTSLAPGTPNVTQHLRRRLSYTACYELQPSLALHSGAFAHGGAVRAAHGRGSARPANGGCQPDQVAPRTYVVVLRDDRARRAGSGVQLPVQQLLRGAGPPRRARAARDAVAAVA